MYRFLFMSVVALLSLTVLSACSNASAHDWKKDSHNAYYESLGVLMDYPKDWTVTQTNRGIFYFTPPGEDEDAVKVRFGHYSSLWSPDRCTWDWMVQRGIPLRDFALCYKSDFRTNGEYLNISDRELKKGEVQIIEAYSEFDGKDNLFAYFPGVDKEGWNQAVEVRFQAVPEKFEEYLPIVEEMLETLRSSR